MDKPEVSIIIINYNTFKLTVDCIRSVVGKTKDVSYEIIVVDNASPHDNADEFLILFPQIVLVKSKNNLGFAGGNNLGIARARGKFILLLNSDTVLVNDAISIAVQKLESDASLGVVGAQLLYENGKIQHNCQRFPSIKYKLFELLRLQKLLGKKIGGRILLGSFFGHDEAIYTDWIWGTFFMFKKDILQKLPGEKLADEFFMYVEDMQWCMEFRKRGYRVAFEPEAKVIHYMGGSGAAQREFIRKNEDIFMKRYYSGVERKLIALLDKLLTL
jgi:GT2 family glycosyltransferase